jgi:hypothetical protein
LAAQYGSVVPYTPGPVHFGPVQMCVYISVSVFISLTCSSRLQETRSHSAEACGSSKFQLVDATYPSEEHQTRVCLLPAAHRQHPFWAVNIARRLGKAACSVAYSSLLHAGCLTAMDVSARGAVAYWLQVGSSFTVSHALMPRLRQTTSRRGLDDNFTRCVSLEFGRSQPEPARLTAYVQSWLNQMLAGKIILPGVRGFVF